MKYPTPAISAALFNAEGKILLTSRFAKVNCPHEWCLPGGHLEGGMSWVETLRKEVKEEVGLVVEEQDLIGIYSDPKTQLVETDMQRRHFLTALFLVKRFSGEIRLNGEADKFGWFGIESLPQPLVKTEPIKLKDAFRFRGLAFVH